VPTSATLQYVNQNDPVNHWKWEEPHPGRRLSCPVESVIHNQQDCGWGAQRLEGSEDSMVGKATTRAMIGYVNEKPEPHQPNGMETGHNTGSSTNSPALDSDSLMSGFASASPSSATTCQTLEVDIDIVQADKMLIDSPRSPSFLAISPVSEYEDLSHYLDGCSSPGSERHSSLSNTGSAGTLSFAAPTQDLYGWDAEWDRRLAIQPDRRLHTANMRTTLLARRGSAHKSNLLQRVFNVGRVPPRLSLSRRSRFS
jgi:hypothetical protein